MKWRKLYEAIQDWELYKVPHCVRLFLHCVMNAADEDGEEQMIYGKGGTPIKMTVLRGQYFTSLATLEHQTGIDRLTARRTLNAIETAQSIEQQKQHQGTLITICNFDNYQSKRIENGTSDATEKRTSNATSNVTSDATPSTREYKERREYIREDNNDDDNGESIKTINAREGKFVGVHTSVENLMRHWNWAIRHYDDGNPPISIKPVEWITPERRETLRKIVEAFDNEAVIRGVKNVMNSDYCNGRTKDRLGKTASFDWVFQSVEQFARCVENRYK